MPVIDHGIPVKSSAAKLLSMPTLDRAIAPKRGQVKLFSLADLAVEPWKNGGGLTRTIASLNSRDGLAAFDWRVSVAEITDSGPFSVFPDVDRTAVVLENGPLKLCDTYVQGQVAPPHYLAPALVPTEFPGDTELFADICGHPITCLNVMTRRGVAQARVEVLEADATLHVGSPTIILSARSNWHITVDSVPVCRALNSGEGAILLGHDLVHACCVAGGGKLIAVHLTEQALS